MCTTHCVSFILPSIHLLSSFFLLPYQGWHADSEHSRFVFGDGASGPPPTLCVFVPLVDLTAPVVVEGGGGDGGDGGEEKVGVETVAHVTQVKTQVNTAKTVTHGRGCTGFWPGSHRYRQCPHIGAIAGAVERERESAREVCFNAVANAHGVR